MKFRLWIESTKTSRVNQYEEAKKQFESVIRSDLNRWWDESDLDAEDLSQVAFKAINDWLDEEIVGFEPN